MIDYDSHNWWDHFFDVHGTMVTDIVARVLGTVVWSAAVVWFHKNVAPVGMPMTLHSLVGLALSLLLVFRTNASYDRFWEGRKLWGGIVNSCRNVVRAARVPLAQRPDLHARLAAWTAQFPFAVIRVLRDGKGELGPSAERLPVDERAAVLAAKNSAVAVAERMSATLGEARSQGILSDIGYMQLDGFVADLVNQLGGCERIHRTPLPFAYVVHLRRALMLFTVTLPFALVETFGWLTVLDVFGISYVFFGIEEIGVETENPFGVDPNDLPLEDIATRIDGVVDSLALKQPADR